MNKAWSERLWGSNAKFSYLFIAAVIMLFCFLGSREIWTQEHRWTDIVSAMFYYHDFLHPSLNGKEYYDKPLLSYWLIAGFSYLLGFTAWAMRMPSALAGILAVWSIYKLGTHLKNKSLGLLAGWMLVTTFYVIFWARTSSADMLNMAGTLFAVAWYFAHKTQTRFFDYVVFFLILALTALCKGLVGPVVACLAILPDVLMKHEWKKHLRFKVILSMIPAAIIYALPFWASAHYGNTNYQENGLTLVYRENILRYFQPFDHKGPIYTYFIFLPVYLLPWTLFFIPALLTLKTRWKNMSANSKWLVWALLLLFIFFTISGSRRNYYVLPLVPFAILLTADWILAGLETWKRNRWAGYMTVFSFGIFFLFFCVGQWLYYAGGGMDNFARNLKQQVEQIKPWSQWNFVMLDPESKVRFYLQLSPEVKNYGIKVRGGQTADSLLQQWPFLHAANNTSNTIYISRQQYAEQLKVILKQYTLVEEQAGWGQKFMKNQKNLAIAFVPINH
jgi:4-amino-4-deoxy-L-arabinose transferase-like glycosyltransferase